MHTITQKDLEKLPHKLQVRFTVFCAEQVTHLLDDKTRDVALKAIEVTKLWLDGKATKEECSTSAAAAYAAANATYAAANAAANAAYAAYYAAYATANAAYATANAAYYAANAAYAAANAAANATYATYATHSSTNKEQTIQAQWDYYYELLNIDTNLEKILLGA